MFEGYFIQYKFILPEATKYSSYSYQKLFRAIYGYTQVVTKANGKKYSYFRDGILSKFPHIRPGKNSVIIPQEALPTMIEFFKTGKNPTHKWITKGDWKAVYYMDEKKLDEATVIKALEGFLDNYYVANASEEGTILLKSKLDSLNFDGFDASKKQVFLQDLKPLVSNSWFKACNSKSEKLSFVSGIYQKLNSL